MNTTKYLFLVLLTTLIGLSARAQQRNVLQVPDVTTQRGNVQLPVNIENTDEIVGAQFDLTLPTGITAENVGVLANRSDGHTVTVNHLASGVYRVLLHSGSNRPLRGQSGMVMYLPIHIPTYFVEGSEHQLTISNAVLAKATGENVLTEATAGKIRIAKLPDLTVKSIACDKSTAGPGDRIVASWQVENVGELATGGGWSEQVSLVSTDGTLSKLIATTYYNETLAASGIVSRQAEITLPTLLGIDGEVRLQVRIVPDNTTGEPASAQGNNTKKSDGTLAVSKLLNISLSPNRVDENSSSSIALRVNRSGRRTAAETFNITTTADSRVSVPAIITIPANQSGAVLYFNVSDNSILDDASEINFTVSGNGYPEATAMLTIDDNELPSLSVVASKSDINEGETFQLTITAGRAASQPITVRLTSDKAKRFTFPTQVVIPVGKTSATIEVTAVDNDEIELQESVVFRVSAENHETGECIVMLGDNDMPTLTFTLSPGQVSEADGYAALFGVIKRTDHRDKRVTIQLSDNSNGLLTYTNKTIVMEKDMTEVQFNIGIADNSQVDGDRVVNVTAAVYASSCDCQVPNGTKGSVTATVTIIDDDGPALKIKSASTSMLEGSVDNVLTVSHNMPSNTDVIVTISSDKDNMLEYNHQVTIPAGQQTASILVNVKSNEQQNDSGIATFKVEADGYAMGTCWTMITDQTLPDAVISLSADKAQAEAGQTVLLHAVVTNVGSTPLPSTTSVKISFSGSKETVSLKVGKTLATGESTEIEYNYALPAVTGQYAFTAMVNPTGEVQELIYANNTSQSVDLILLSPFSVTAQANKDVYTQGEQITISGSTSGSMGKNANIEVYVINEGVRQTITAKSDENGHYNVSWTPQARQMGHFAVGACYPGAGSTEQMDQFDVYGLRVSTQFSTCEIGLSETFSGKIVVSNPTALNQTGLTITPMTVSPNCEFSFNAPVSISGNQEVEISYTVRANGLSEGHDWQKMPLEITTAEGVKLDYILYYFVQPQHASLQADVTSISTTMTMGMPREYPIVIRNIGKGESGTITLALADWIETSTPRKLESLAPGESTTIVLRFMPTSDMKLNLGVNGQVGINCTNGNGTFVKYSVIPVSEATGTLKVDVVDEYTFFTEEAPHVSGATVKVKHPATGAIVAEGLTGANGTFTADIAAGWYTISVEADRHNSYSNTLIINPGQDNNEEVFLQFQAITYSWDVKETEVEDEYEIETIVKYETRIPKPVVIITLPEENPEPYSIIPVILTNKGLISAVDVNLSLSINNDYRLEFLNNPSLAELAPQQSHVFYAKMVPISSGNDESRSGGQMKVASTTRCYTLIARAVYKELCLKYTGDELAEAIKKWGSRHCYGTGGGSGSGGSSGGGWGGWGGPGYPGGWGGNSQYDDYIRIDDLDDPAKFCDKVVNEDNDEGEPEETENCDEEPTFVFKLKDYKTGNKRTGLAADGSSKIKIVISSESVIPSEECDVTYRWELSENIGELKEESSWKSIVYSAPDHFPSENGDTYPIEATLYYKKANSTEEVATKVSIELIRVPVLFVHGLNSSGSIWADMMKSLTKKKELYRDFQLMAVDYSDTHNDSFDTNVDKIGMYSNLLSLVATKGYTAEKVDVVGHSMGGLLTKKYIQEKDHGEHFNRFITLNTPHGGSQLGDFLNDPRVQYVRDIKDLIVENPAFILDPLLIPPYTNLTPHPVSRTVIRKLYDMFSPSKGDFAKGAVADLSVAGSAIRAINNNSTSGVKCHAVTSTTNHVARTLLDDVFAAFEYSSSSSFLNELFNGEASDLIVPLSSQKGGIENPYVSSYASSSDWGMFGDSWNYIHINSYKADDIINKVGTLLSSIGDEQFHDGFNDTGVLSYDMPTLDNVYSIYTASNSILPGSSDTRRGAMPKLDQSGSYPYLTLQYEFSESEPTMSVHINKVGDFEHVAFGGFYEDQILGYFNTEEGVINLPAKTKGKVVIMSEGRTPSGVWCSRSDTISFSTIGSSQITSIGSASETLYVVNDAYAVPHIYATWDDGSETDISDYELEIDKSIAYANKDHKIFGVKSGQTILTIKYKGHVCNIPVFVEMQEDKEGDDSPSICSTVTLSFKQKSVMTRQAFRGTLTVNNGNETTAMTDVKMNLEVRDMNGNLTTSHEFQIDAESLKGFTGNVDFTSGWTLAGGATGMATILFIPTKYAAPTEPQDYAFGGSFSYTDPFTGLTVTRNLNPVTLTVKPSPDLDLTYFLQRDVLGDDPQTEEIEPMVPAEFALVVNNKGYGDVPNMTLTTEQPKIVDNQKNLVINFEIIGSQLNGGEKALALGGSTISNFGTIPAHSQAYAQWWLQSSLLGHFIEYDVKATHLSSRNNPDLSMLDEVTIHELIHGFTVKNDGDKPVRGFLVNDIADTQDLPDAVYFTDATQQEAYIASGANIVKQSDTEYVMNVDASNAGWNYGSLLDPTNGKQKLVKVTRADGTEVSVDNVWQTDRTLRDGKDPLYENRLHFVGNMAATGETFYLTFEARPELELAVESFAGVPEEGTVLKEQLKTLTVKFNKPIKAETFTTDDITINCQGVAQDASQIVITKQSEKEYMLTLNEVTLQDGYYVLTVQTANIEDAEGFKGSTGKHAAWIQFVDGKATLKVAALPADGGSITPGSGRYALDSDVTLTATPATGYDFSHWLESEANIGNEPQLTHHVVGDANLTAVFTLRHYDVTIGCDETQGTVTGAATGIYEHGTMLQLTAVPSDDNTFSGWLINGQMLEGATETITITVVQTVTVQAIFAQNDMIDQTITAVEGWNWISTYLNEPVPIEGITIYANRIVSQFDELINDPQFGMVGGITSLMPGRAYKVEGDVVFSETFEGHLYNIDAMPITLNRGWNWIAYPYMYAGMISDVVTNASEGDFIVTQTGFTEFTDGHWQGSIDMLSPGEGCLYKSATNKELKFDFSSLAGQQSRVWRSMRQASAEDMLNIHRYPNTMNITARLYRDGIEQNVGNYHIYAMANNDLRGIAQQVGSNYYLTVYGDEPVDINFVIESAETGNTYVANEVLSFRDDVVGSRKEPFTIGYSSTTGIDLLEDASRPMTVYSLEGILISRDATLKTLRRLPKGIYIVNGQKCYVK